ncbi:MAG: acyltransferase [Candidatus Competibacter denitrificans]
MYFDNINLLRAFAALSVLVYHVIEFFPWKNFPVEGPLLWFRIGWLGVDLFFVISGFLITLVALQLFKNYGSDFYKIYLRRRLARIAPLYFLTGFVFLVFLWSTFLNSGILIKNIVYHLLFIHNLDAETHRALNAPNWSIGVEMQFYLLILLTIRYLVRLHPLIILLACITISWAWRALVFFLLCHDMTCTAEVIFVPSTQLPGCLDGFGFGICLARVILDKNGQFYSISSIYQSACFWTATGAVVAWPTFNIYWQWSSYWEFWWMVIFWKTLPGVIFFAVLIVAIKVISLIKINKFIFIPFWYLGEISYGIYLWHFLVILILGKTKIFTAEEFLVLTLFFTISLSIFSWHFLEKPIIRRFHELA